MNSKIYFASKSVSFQSRWVIFMHQTTLRGTNIKWRLTYRCSPAHSHRCSHMHRDQHTRCWSVCVCVCSGSRSSINIVPCVHARLYICIRLFYCVLSVKSCIYLLEVPDRCCDLQEHLGVRDQISRIYFQFEWKSNKSNSFFNWSEISCSHLKPNMFSCLKVPSDVCWPVLICALHQFLNIYACDKCVLARRRPCNCAVQCLWPVGNVQWLQCAHRECTKLVIKCARHSWQIQVNANAVSFITLCLCTTVIHFDDLSVFTLPIKTTSSFYWLLVCLWVWDPLKVGNFNNFRIDIFHAIDCIATNECAVFFRIHRISNWANGQPCESSSNCRRSIGVMQVAASEYRKKYLLFIEFVVFVCWTWIVCLAWWRSNA